MWKDGLIVFSTWFLRISSFKIESSGYGSKKNLDSILKVNIGTGKKRWQKIPPGLPQTERIIQAMVNMDSTLTVAMKALKRFQKRNSDWKAKPQNSIFGPGCNQNYCHMGLTASPCSQKLTYCGKVMTVYLYLSLSIREFKVHFSMYWTLQKRTLNMLILTVSSTTEEKHELPRLSFFFSLNIAYHYPGGNAQAFMVVKLVVWTSVEGKFKKSLVFESFTNISLIHRQIKE